MSLSNLDKEFAPQIAQDLVSEGFNIVATGGTHKVITDAGIDCEKVLKVSEGRPHIIDSLMNEDIVMAINTTDENVSSKDDGIKIRRTVLRMNTPYVTTVAAALASIEGIKALKAKDMEPKSIQEFLGL
jgi:carbamoyl-phosphate synthase large subunit